ncbi:hypothetical protein, partial [Glaesserella parasuis]|uniref:hypothetical protein n=1 Tax=Glaesserella parasuis TaxID=738 RepID=UPI003B681266
VDERIFLGLQAFIPRQLSISWSSACLEGSATHNLTMGRFARRRSQRTSLSVHPRWMSLQKEQYR